MQSDHIKAENLQSQSDVKTVFLPTHSGNKDIYIDEFHGCGNFGHDMYW